MTDPNARPDPVPPPEPAPLPPRDPAVPPAYAAPPEYASPPPESPFTQPDSRPAPPPPAPGGSPQVLSIISMISGILGVVIGFVGWGLLFSIGAVVLGHLGQRRERAAKGFWITGLITGYAGILVNIVVIVFWVILLVAIASSGDWNWYNYEDFNDFR